MRKVKETEEGNVEFYVYDNRDYSTVLDSGVERKRDYRPNCTGVDVNIETAKGYTVTIHLTHQDITDLFRVSTNYLEDYATRKKEREEKRKALRELEKKDGDNEEDKE